MGISIPVAGPGVSSTQIIRLVMRESYVSKGKSMFPPRLRVNEFIVKKYPLFLANGISARRKRNKRGREPILDSGPSRSGLDPSGSLLIDSDLICDCCHFMTIGGSIQGCPGSRWWPGRKVWWPLDVYILSYEYVQRQHSHLKAHCTWWPHPKRFSNRAAPYPAVITSDDASYQQTKSWLISSREIWLVSFFSPPNKPKTIKSAR